MKKILTGYGAWAVLVGAALSLFSCGKEDTPSPKDATRLAVKDADGNAVTTLELTGEATEVVLNVLSDGAWTVTAPAWAGVSAKSGTGDGTLTLSVLENSTGQSRSGVVLFRYGNASAGISVSQADKNAVPSKVDNLVVAHRGAWKEYNLPGNSLAALRRAISLGCYGSECDINITSDGQVIIMHDGTWGGLVVKDHTYSEISAARLTNGEPVPLLETFLKEVMRKDASEATRLWIDCKSLSDAEGGNAHSIKAAVAAARLVKQMGAQQYVAFIVGRIDVWNGAVAEVQGAWPVAYMDVSRPIASFKELCSGHQPLWANFDISTFGLDDAKLAQWQAAGIQMSFYNFDTTEQMDWYAKYAATMMGCSNYPATLMKKLGLR